MRDERPLFCHLTKTGRLTGGALSDKAVARLVKQAAASGLDRSVTPATRCAPGSPPAAAGSGAGLAELMRQTRHTSTEVGLGYLSHADLWRNNVTEKLFSVGQRKPTE